MIFSEFFILRRQSKFSEYILNPEFVSWFINCQNIRVEKSTRGFSLSFSCNQGWRACLVQEGGFVFLDLRKHLGLFVLCGALGTEQVELCDDTSQNWTHQGFQKNREEYQALDRKHCILEQRNTVIEEKLQIIVTLSLVMGSSWQRAEISLDENLITIYTEATGKDKFSPFPSKFH